MAIEYVSQVTNNELWEKMMNLFHQLKMSLHLGNWQIKLIYNANVCLHFLVWSACPSSIKMTRQFSHTEKIVFSNGCVRELWFLQGHFPGWHIGLSFLSSVCLLYLDAFVLV